MTEVLLEVIRLLAEVEAKAQAKMKILLKAFRRDRMKMIDFIRSHRWISKLVVCKIGSSLI